MKPINLQGMNKVCLNVPVLTSIEGVTLSIVRTGDEASKAVFNAVSLTNGNVCFGISGIEKHGRYTATVDSGQGCTFCFHCFIPDDCTYSNLSAKKETCLTTALASAA